MFSFKNTVFILFIAAFSACKSDKKTSDDEKIYFDIRSFFTNEALRLQKKNPTVIKLVSDGIKKEQKTLNISSWDHELELFKESDINKPSWKNSYAVKSSVNSITYSAKDPDLRTRSIVITRSNEGKVVGIIIQNQINNSLYSSVEKLTYYPDSLYIIDKSQDVRVLGEHNYIVKGKF